MAAVSLVVEYYAVSEASRDNDKYPKHCDECIYVPVWTIRTQLPMADPAKRRIGYGCSEHIDAVMMKIAYQLPPGDQETPPAK